MILTFIDIWDILIAFPDLHSYIDSLHSFSSLRLLQNMLVTFINHLHLRYGLCYQQSNSKNFQKTEM